MLRFCLALLAASASALRVAPAARAPTVQAARAPAVAMAAAADDFVPDMQRRTIMNLVLLGGAGVPVLWLAGGYIYFLVPPGGGGGGAGVTARDALGADVMAAKWIAANPYPGRALVEGLKGDAHYLIVKEDKTLYDFAINAVCALPAATPSLSTLPTRPGPAPKVPWSPGRRRSLHRPPRPAGTHLGCVVPFNRAQLKYICPCHGSQYDFNGKVIRGPAPLSLALAHVNDVDGKVVLSPWTETDFRTDLAPWWK